MDMYRSSFTPTLLTPGLVLVTQCCFSPLLEWMMVGTPRLLADNQPNMDCFNNKSHVVLQTPTLLLQQMVSFGQHQSSSRCHANIDHTGTLFPVQNPNKAQFIKAMFN